MTKVIMQMSVSVDGYVEGARRDLAASFLELELIDELRLAGTFT